MIRGVIEGSALFRVLNYLRISHHYSIRYNVVYPVISGTIGTCALVVSHKLGSVFIENGLLASFAPVLTVLSPFYIAALAATATFAGSKSIDRPFEMSEPVTLEIVGGGGDWEVIEVTPRHFLSLLFGYCATVSLLLLAFVLFSPVVSVFLRTGVFSDIIAIFVVFGFLFLISQLVVSTLLGVYYLSDRLHRR